MKSIGFRLTSIMLCVILLGFGITIGIAVSISSNVITRESISKVQKATESEALKMDNWLNVQKANLKTLAEALSKLDNPTEDRQAEIFAAVMEGNSSYFEVYMGYPDGTATTASGYQFDYTWWQSYERGWYKLAMTDTSRPHITSPYVDAQTGELCITAVHAVESNGTLLGVVAADIFVTDLQSMTMAATLDSTGYSMLLDSNGDILIHPDADYAPDKDGNFRNLDTVMDNAYADLWKQVSAEDQMLKYKDVSGVVKYYTANTLGSVGWHFVTVLPVKVITQPITTVILIVIPLTLVILVVSALLIFFTVRNIITRPITTLAKAADDLSAGDIGIRIEDGYQGEMGALAEAFQHIADSVDKQARSAKAIADGDLTTHIDVRSERDEMGHAFRNLLNKLNLIFSEIISSSDQVSSGSQQVAKSAQELSSGSSEQAANIEELSQTLTELGQRTNQNSENSKSAQQANERVETLIEDSVKSMGEMLNAMRAIDDSSKNINKVIKVIDDIAFQTNILALNAAVEAARAGQHGKGFAVVADEVRNLAGKSAAAARETAELIAGSSQNVEEGNRLVEQTSSHLEAVAQNARESVRLVNEVTAASGEQAKSIHELHQGMEQISSVVQINSSTAEQSAAAAEEMSAQAVVLNEIVAGFKLKGSV